MKGSLEEKIQKANVPKPDWKEWLPLYGPCQVLRDILNGNPTILEQRGSSAYYVSALYHGTVAWAGTQLLGNIVAYLSERI